MKFVALSLALSLAAFSHASFEMMLIADNTNGVIHRYDPVNRVYLGSFGQGSLLPVTSMALDQTNGRVFVKQGSLLTAFNYATGEALFSRNAITGAITYRESFGDLIFGNSTNIYRQPVSMTFFGSTSVYANNAPNFAQVTTDGSNVFVANPSEGTLVRYSGSSTATSIVSTGPSGLFGDTVIGMMTSESGENHFALSATDRRYYGTNSSATSLIFSEQSSLIAPTAITRGHGSYGYFLGETATGFGYQKFFDDGLNRQNFSQVTLPGQIASVNSAVTVLAPEPGSMIALGVGVAALLRKRKSGELA